MQETQAETKHKISSTKATGWTMLSLGAAALIALIHYNSQMLAFIGLGLIFWGGILAYIQTEEYIRENLPDTRVLPSLATINQIIRELDYEGDAIYLSPKYLGNAHAREVSHALFCKT